MRIALLTDFGTRDPYVAAMKGVIAGRCDAEVLDLSHEIEPFDVFAAAWFLRETERWWPQETIFVCVVDPGVGSERKIVAAGNRGRIFLAPDNGLLTFVEAESIHAVTNERLFLPAGSDTFHGRDRFAPVAASLAAGLPVTELGPALTAIERLPWEPARYEGSVEGTVVRIDRFGNLVTDLEAARIPFTPAAIRCGAVSVQGLVRTYEEGGEEPFLIVGSSGTLEISCRRASAASRLGIRSGQRVVVDPNV